ncbi:hypothetical protein ACOMHN_054827 [Nucella lapillus]
MTTCVPQVSNDLSNEALNKSQSERSVGQSSQGSRGIMSSLRDMLNRTQDTAGPEELLLDMTYVTERIISMSFPSEGHDTTYAFNLKDVVRMLKTKHGDNYLVLNLSEKRQDLVKANPQVKDYGWPDHLAPPLERLCSVCKAVDAWLHADARNVAVLHCKGGRARIAIIIAAYMHYSNICASADQALDRFAMKRFYEDKLGGLPHPSQKRYLHYFAGLLSGAIKINTNPLYLHHILIHGVPNFDTRGGCRPFIKVYQGMQPIFMSGVYNVTDNMQKVCISISPGIPLRGDILIKCYHKKAMTGQREVIWQCQFHTCAIQDTNVVFSKHELDDAVHDPRFPDNGKVEFVFGPSSDTTVSVSGFKSDVTVPVDDNEENITRSDSYENFYKALAAQGLEKNANKSAVNGVSAQARTVHVGTAVPVPVHHTQGPKDGSLYATVNKQHATKSGEGDLTSLPHNGPTHLPNGSVTSSVDSGYAGPRDTSYGSQQQQQPPQVEARPSSHPHQSQVNTTRTNFSSSTLSRSAGGSSVAEDQLNYNSLPPQPRQPVQVPAPTVDERSQLDDLLSDLLSDQVIASPKSPQQSLSGPRSPLSPASPPQQSGGKSMMTTATHSYSSFSSPDGGGVRSPPADGVFVQRADMSYRSPGQFEDRQKYSTGGEVPDSERSRVPKGAFTYTPTSPSSQPDRAHAYQSLERDMSRTDHGLALQQSPPSRTQTLPYRADYENRYTASEGQHYNTMDSEQTSWLQQQQQKLQRMREGRDASGRTEQEKQLVNELRVAQNRYFRQRAHSDAEEQVVMNTYRQPPMHNGPLSAPPTHAPPPREFGGETGHFNTFSQSQSQFVESHFNGGGERSSNKPPPSPTMQRSQVQPASAPPPVQPPVRSSSKDYMRSRSQSGGSSHVWPVSTPHPPAASRTLVRQYSDTLYDREQRLNLQAQLAPSSQSTPPLSPHALSPTLMDPNASTTYTTYKTIHKELHDEPHPPRPQHAVQHQHQQQVVTVPVLHSQAPPPPGPSAQQPQSSAGHQQHNYVTEVFVHRVGGEKGASGSDRVDGGGGGEDTRLDELTRSLQAASDSIMEERVSHAQPQQQQQQVVQQTWQEYSQTSQVQKSHEAPAPKPVGVVEEDGFMLKPIGPGMQTLEPDAPHSTGTLNRSTSSGFPTSPVTPPFPVSPRTMQDSAVKSPPQSTSSPPPATPDVASVSFYESEETLSGSYVAPQVQSSGLGAMAPVVRISDPLYAAIPDITPRDSAVASYTGSSGVNAVTSCPGQKSLFCWQSLISWQPEHTETRAVRGPFYVRRCGPLPLPDRTELPSVYFGLSRRGSLSSLADSDMIPTTPKFVKDTSKFWYKPNITREEAIALLRDRAPGTFVIRDSNSFPGAFGLALKVAQVPANMQSKPSHDPQSELVRHFLIEPTPKGVRLRGCSNEPIFGSLAALVYQHSITPLALPCKLSLPDGGDAVDGPISPDTAAPELNSAADLLAKGAACNVVFINTVDTESLTGPQAIAKAIKTTMETPAPKTTVVHFKVSSQGITLTDNNRKLFFRRHYPVSSVTYCGMDPQDRRWKRDTETPGVQVDAKIFGFVARKQGGMSDNSCHLFAETDPEQPASAIVNFVTKVMIGQSKVKS